MFISVPTYRKIYCSDGVLPTAYDLPKIHKRNCPFRIIISSIDSPLYFLATFLHEIINSSIPKARGYIANSYDLFNNLNDRGLSSEFSLISLDVISLFTNIPIDLAMECLTERWSYISPNCRIPKKEFHEAVRLILDSTFFIFDNQIYKQNFGTPMGSPLSPVIADIVMQNLENSVLRTADFHIPIYHRYVDDILMAVPKNKINWVLEAFNSFNSRLQFMLEVGDDRINFLDTTIILHNNKIKLDWYHKPTDSGRYLNYYSQHPPKKEALFLALSTERFYSHIQNFTERTLNLLLTPYLTMTIL